MLFNSCRKCARTPLPASRNASRCRSKVSCGDWTRAPPGCLRIVLSREDRTELMHLSDDETYRSFPGRFVRLHPTRSYLITELEASTASGGRRMTSGWGRRLEDGDRELAILLAHHRLRHEISLEAHLPVSRHDIELDG